MTLVPNSFFFLCVAIFLYAVIITVKVFSSEYTLRNACLKPCSAWAEKQDAAVDVGHRLHPWDQELDFEGFDNETGTPDGHYIVPNYVHFVKFGDTTFSFVHAVCILAAFKNQRPEKLFIHTDQDDFVGKYWNVIMDTPGFKDVLVIQKMEVPTEIFGQKLSTEFQFYHGSDVVRLMVMLKYGGIYLDNDSYMVRSLDDFRRYEMSIGWFPDKNMENQILVAHKNARFLRLWYNSYKRNYNPLFWNYNGGAYPTYHILDIQPYLVDRVEKLFGIYNIKAKIFTSMFPQWRNFYTLHLLSSKLKGLRNISDTIVYPVVFDEENVLKYPVAFRDMCEAVYPFREIIFCDTTNKNV